MLRKLRKRIKGQSTAEYAILIAFVVAAVIAMQTYAKRALQARIKDASDYLVNQTDSLGDTVQYEPYYLTTNFLVDRDTRQETRLEGSDGARLDSTLNITRGGGQTFSYNAGGTVAEGMN